MAGHAIRRVAMGIGMTVVTGNLAVDARVGVHFLALLGVAGQTLHFQFAGQGDLEGLMRVMTAVARVQGVMIGPDVTVRTGRNIAGTHGAMLGVTVKAVDGKLVRCTVIGDLTGFQGVAFDAVVNGEGGSGYRSAKNQEQGPRQEQGEKKLVSRTTDKHETSSLH